MLEPRVTVLDTDFVSVWCYPNEGIIHHQFHRYSFGEEFREILMAAAEAFEKNGCTKWLSDDREFGAVHPDDKAWGDEAWLPKVMGAGWKYWAMVLPEKVTGMLNLQRLASEYEKLGLIVSVHPTPEEAMAWLLEQK